MEIIRSVGMDTADFRETMYEDGNNQYGTDCN